MSVELLNSFDVLDVNTKRNQISDELIIIHELIKKYEETKNITPITKVKNYDTNNDGDMTEAEMLTFLYEDIYNIQQELITLLSSLANDTKKL